MCGKKIIMAFLDFYFISQKFKPQHKLVWILFLFFLQKYPLWQGIQYYYQTIDTNRIYSIIIRPLYFFSLQPNAFFVNFSQKLIFASFFFSSINFQHLWQITTLSSFPSNSYSSIIFITFYTIYSTLLVQKKDFLSFNKFPHFFCCKTHLSVQTFFF